jgi:hypothetical protein
LRPQRLLLDRRIALLYIGAGLLLVGCPRPLPPLIPQPLAPADRDSAVRWAAATVPAHRTDIKFRWRYQDDQKRWGGRGRARVAPPDSLRFDYVGPLGLGAGAAALVGDSAIWADPEKNFRSLVPAVRMLWAGLGIVRPPAADAAVFDDRPAAHADSGLRLWRFVEGGDTLDYRESPGGGGTAGRVLEAEWRQRGKVVARSRTQLDVHELPAVARIDFPEAGGGGGARLEFTVVATDTAATFDAAIWRGRR